MKRTRTIQGVEVPTFFYGTAWKEDRTSELVKAALAAGFRAVDTANQRKHYHEAAVGDALKQAFAAGLRREDVFVQTKFTHLASQDHRLPYDPSAPIARQVAQSFERSLEHLGVDTIDSLVLHGPSQRHGLAPEDVEAWHAMEALHDAGRVRFLGVSNVAPDQLESLLLARVRPTFVQNRCFASQGWDAKVRAICAREGLVYQGFSLLTANDALVRRGVVADIARTKGATVAQVVFRFALAVGMIPLTGTSSETHMVEDLAAHDLELDAREVHAIEHLVQT
jgi:diketogulonate reductase-like aldo/keto reductase